MKSKRAAIRCPVAKKARAAGADAKPVEFYLASADPAKGEAVFKKCAACHVAAAGGANGIGPNLWAVVGGPIGKHAPGFAYSEALSGKGGNWDWKSLDDWLSSPRAFAPGTKMTFAGLGDPQDRANVIAYLNKQGSNLPIPAAPAEAAPAARPAEGKPPLRPLAMRRRRPRPMPPRPPMRRRPSRNKDKRRRSAQATTVADYLAELPPQQSAAVAHMRDLVNQALPPGFREAFAYGMIVWAIPLEVYPDTYNKQPLGIVALGARKTGLTLHLFGIYASPELRARLEQGFAAAGKKLDMGKGCLRFRTPRRPSARDARATCSARSIPPAISVNERARAVGRC